MEDVKCFYVYIHRRASDNLVFYVGKGKGYRYTSYSSRNSHWKNTKNKHGIIPEIVFDNLSEEEALQCEIDTIKEFTYFGHPLTNKTLGGEGVSGHKQSKETRDKLHSKRIPKIVFTRISRYLRGKSFISVKKLALITGLDPNILCRSPGDYGKVPRKGVEKSALKRTGVPPHNTGKRQTSTVGFNNPSSDKNKYKFVNVKTKETFYGTRYELCEKFNLNIIQLGKLFYKKANKTSQGWARIKEEK